MAMRWIVGSGLLVLGLFLVTLPLPRVDGHIAGSDGLYYHAILRSAVIDHDLDLRDEYAALGVKPYAPTPTGRPGAPFAVGTPVLWAPWFLLAHGVATLVPGAAGSGSAGGSASGFGVLYESAVCIGTILYAFAGLVLVFRTARRLTGDDFSAAIAALAAWWATSLVEYTLAEPSMSHGASFFANALFLAWFFRPGRDWTPARLGALGAAAGLVALVRSQEGLVVLLPAAAVVREVVSGRLRADRGLAGLAAMGLAFAVVFSPQLLFWHSVYGSWLTVPQGSDWMRWGSPQPGLILFSSRHGLVSWHPVILVMLLGLPALARRDSGLAIAVVLFFGAQLYVNSVVSQWWAGDAFGGRRFCGTLPWLAMPLAALVADVARTRGRALVVAAGLALAGWNALALLQYRAGLVSRSEALTLREMTVGRLEAPFVLARRMRHRVDPAGARP